MSWHHEHLHLETGPGFSVHDITAEVGACVARAGVREGIVVVSSLHTTLAVAVNENERRLIQDLRDFFLRLAPPDAGWLHNDIHLRDCPPDEPENAHAHLIALMLGNSEAIPVHAGALELGRWQSVFAVELDGPRERRLAVQICGE